MNYKILFPCAYEDIRNVDSSFDDEYDACKMLGIPTCLYDYDELVNEDKFISNLTECDGIIIYRGWMLKPVQYKLLYDNVLKVTLHADMINRPEDYDNCHCFPNVYKTIQEFTPITIPIKDHEDRDEIRDSLCVIGDRFIIKDHVKSTKIGNNISYYDKHIRLTRIIEIFNEFIRERGNLYTNGIVIKEYVDLEKKVTITNEWRAFYMFGELMTINLNSERKISECKKPPVKFVEHIGDLLGHKSNFFTVDFALKSNGEWIVIETGDAQVSGMPYYSKAIVFYAQLYTFILAIQ